MTMERKVGDVAEYVDDDRNGDDVGDDMGMNLCHTRFESNCQLNHGKNQEIVHFWHKKRLAYHQHQRSC